MLNADSFHHISTTTQEQCFFDFIFHFISFHFPVIIQKYAKKKTKIKISKIFRQFFFVLVCLLMKIRNNKIENCTQTISDRSSYC